MFPHSLGSSRLCQSKGPRRSTKDTHLEQLILEEAVSTRLHHRDPFGTKNTCSAWNQKSGSTRVYYLSTIVGAIWAGVKMLFQDERVNFNEKNRHTIWFRPEYAIGSRRYLYWHKIYFLKLDRTLPAKSNRELPNLMSTQAQRWKELEERTLKNCRFCTHPQASRFNTPHNNHALHTGMRVHVRITHWISLLAICDIMTTNCISIFHYRRWQSFTMPRVDQEICYSSINWNTVCRTWVVLAWCNSLINMETNTICVFGMVCNIFASSPLSLTHSSNCRDFQRCLVRSGCHYLYCGGQ